MRLLYFKLVILGLALFLGACSSDDASNTNNQFRLNQNLNKWQLTSLSTYQYNLRRMCFCGPDYTREVMIRYTNSLRDSVAYADDLSQPSEDNYSSIEDLFSIVQDAINNQEADLIVEYHPLFGYPTRISRDPLPQAVDDEIIYVLDHFKTNNILYTSTLVVSNTDGFTTAAGFTIDMAQIKLAGSAEFDFDALILNISTISSCGRSFFRFYASTALTKSLPPQATTKITRQPSADDVCDFPQSYQIVVDLTPYKQEMTKVGVSDIVLHIDSFALQYQFTQ